MSKMYFDEFDIGHDLLDAIDYMGFKTATPIQEKVIPEILDGRDVLACAQTGTGKTVAFVLPILELICRNEGEGARALIMVPTRELALQIDQQIQGLSYFLHIHSDAIYGGGDGNSWSRQKKALTGGAHVIVATPGKLISHLNMGYVAFDQVELLVLDEADRMLDMNFYDDIMKISTFLPGLKQTALFSATMSPKMKMLTKGLLKNPFRIELELSKPAEGVTQIKYEIIQGKPQLIADILRKRDDLNSILIFTSTKAMVSIIVKALRAEKFSPAGISSNLKQEERENVVRKFRSKTLKILVATDVMSRGIDIADIDMVINYDVPQDAEDYVHRVGRTARAKSTGIAITLVDNKDKGRMQRIETLIGSKVKEEELPAAIKEMQIKSSGGNRNFHSQKRKSNYRGKGRN